MLAFIACDSVTKSTVSPAGNGQTISITGIAEEPVDNMEQTSLLFMREEEKVARMYICSFTSCGNYKYSRISLQVNSNIWTLY